MRDRQRQTDRDRDRQTDRDRDKEKDRDREEGLTYISHTANSFQTYIQIIHEPLFN